MDKYTVRDDSGAVDVLASAEKYAVALQKWVEDNELPVDTLDSAVNAVFDQFVGKRLAMPYLLSAAIQHLGIAPENFAAVTDRLRKHVQGQAKLGTISIAKGASGGVARVCDLPPKAEDGK